MAHPPFDFEVITPDGPRFRGRVTSLRLTGRDGSFGILAHHAPLIAALDSGRLDVTPESGATQQFAAGEGFVEVRKAGVRALVDFCESKEEIDVARAKESERRARERLQSKTERIDRARAEAALRRALMRLQVAEA